MEAKAWYQSLTIWGAVLIGVCAAVLPMFGKAEVAAAVQANQTDIMTILSKVGELIGLILVVVGRIRASTQVTMVLLLSFVLLFGFCGCSNVQMSAGYAQQTRRAATIVKQLTQRCMDGDDSACKIGCVDANSTLQLLVNAIDGTVGK